jgi:hypothetical protein
MHPLRHPRNAAMVGILFVVIGLGYWGAQEIAGFMVDFAGVTMLVALGAAMAIMAYVLVAGSPSD